MAHLGLAVLVAASHAAAQCTPNWSVTQFGGGPILAMVVYDDGTGPALFIGGQFVDAGGVTGASRVAKWNGSTWVPLGAGLVGYTGAPPIAYALATHDPDGLGPSRPVLIVGGRFERAGSDPASNIAAWDGVSWSPLGAAVTSSPSQSPVTALASVDLDGTGPDLPRLIAGGSFVAMEGEPARRIASWDGTAWASLGAGLDGGPDAIAGFDEDGPGPLPPRVYAGGYAVLYSSTAIYGMARWDRSAWSGIGGLCCGVGELGTVKAMHVFDDDGPGPRPAALYAAGNFKIDGTNCWHAGRWDGQAWEPLASGLSQFRASFVFALADADFDGPGGQPATLFASGDFRIVDGGPADYIAQWDGARWSPIGYAPPSLSPSLKAMASWDDDGPGPRSDALFMGSGCNCTSGPFARFFRYDCAPCYANCDRSTAAPILNVNDFTCFLNAFAAGSPAANCDGSTLAPTLNVNDFTCFLNVFAAGCP